MSHRALSAWDGFTLTEPLGGTRGSYESAIVAPFVVSQPEPRNNVTSVRLPAGSFAGSGVTTQPASPAMAAATWTAPVVPFSNDTVAVCVPPAVDVRVVVVVSTTTPAGAASAAPQSAPRTTTATSAVAATPLPRAAR